MILMTKHIQRDIYYKYIQIMINIKIFQARQVLKTFDDKTHKSKLKQ